MFELSTYAFGANTKQQNAFLLKRCVLSGCRVPKFAGWPKLVNFLHQKTVYRSEYASNTWATF